MTKLTPAQDNAIKVFGETGKFPKGTRAATIEGIRSAGLIVSLENDGTWDLTPDGRAYLGLPAIPNTATTDEVLAELNTNPWDNVTEHATVDDALDHLSAEKWSRTKNAIAELNGEADKPFVVQQLFGNIWQRVGRSARTWGTANVWRNRMASQGLTVRVHNVISDQVWA